MFNEEHFLFFHKLWQDDANDETNEIEEEKENEKKNAFKSHKIFSSSYYIQTINWMMMYVTWNQITVIPWCTFVVVHMLLHYKLSSLHQLGFFLKWFSSSLLILFTHFCFFFCETGNYAKGAHLWKTNEIHKLRFEKKNKKNYSFDNKIYRLKWYRWQYIKPKHQTKTSNT